MSKLLLKLQPLQTFALQGKFVLETSILLMQHQMIISP